MNACLILPVSLLEVRGDTACGVQAVQYTSTTCLLKTTASVFVRGLHVRTSLQGALQFTPVFNGLLHTDAEFQSAVETSNSAQVTALLVRNEAYC